MRQRLPENLGSEFWFSLFMVMVGIAGGLLGLLLGSGYKAFVGGLIALIFIVRAYRRVRDVRLGQRLKLDPTMSRIYYAQD